MCIALQSSDHNTLTTSKSVLLIVASKCTLAASHVAPAPLLSHVEYALLALCALY